MAWRYFRSHGPATVKDFTRWTGLVAADVRAGLARPRLASIDAGGIEYLMDPGTPELLDSRRPRARGVFLLPGFDGFVLGYADRCASLPEEFADRIVPGGNVISDGQIIGTWDHTGRGRKRTVAATPFTSFPSDVAETIPAVYATLPQIV